MKNSSTNFAASNKLITLYIYLFNFVELLVLLEFFLFNFKQLDGVCDEISSMTECSENMITRLKVLENNYNKNINNNNIFLKINE
jgi:hypothetical protein